MIAFSHKSKQYLLASLKVFVLAIAFGYIYSKLTASDGLDFSTFWETLSSRKTSWLSILVFFILAAANWFFEILKWKTVVSVVQVIPLKIATGQSLSSLTVSLATPNRIGDYGAKAFFFKPEKRKQILLLNFFSNATQMGVTCFFGVIGLAYMVPKFGISYSVPKVLLFLLSILLLVFLGYIFKEKQLLLKGLSIAKVIKYIKNISGNIKTRVLLLSVIRYFTFSFLFFLLIQFFGGKSSFTEGILIIFSMYLLVSLIPTFFIFDVVIRGGVAVWLFALAGVPQLSVLCTVLAMWLLNFVIPAVLGGIYVVTYKHKTQ